MSDSVPLIAQQLTRSFRGRVAVDALDLRVETGDVYGFLGPNGAGKTTAIRCILGLMAPDRGVVRIFGETQPVKLRQHVGAMVETPAFHETLSARENLRLAIAYAGVGGAADVDRVLDRVGLFDRAEDKVGTYSLGMRQRLGIARALVSQPRFLILDEPTNGLDPRGMRDVRDLIRSLAKDDGLTVLVSSHLLGEIEAMCNRVGILEKGRMVREGTVSELVSGMSQGDLVDVRAGDPAHLRAVVQGLDGVSLVEGAEGEAVRVLTEDVGDLNRRLVEAGVSVQALIPASASLEELFLHLTAKELS